MSPHIPGYTQLRRRPARYSSLTALLPALLLAGCAKSGPELAPVGGRVTLDGQPMLAARLVFQPEANGSPSYGSTDRDGRYELGYKRGQKGAKIGWHTVRITSDLPRAAGGKISPSQVLPARYNEQSELRREVKSDDENRFDFKLTSEAE